MEYRSLLLQLEKTPLNFFGLLPLSMSIASSNSWGVRALTTFQKYGSNRLPAFSHTLRSRCIAQNWCATAGRHSATASLFPGASFLICCRMRLRT